jgi:hypothetical protein
MDSLSLSLYVCVCVCVFSMILTKERSLTDDVQGAVWTDAIANKEALQPSLFALTQYNNKVIISKFICRYAKYQHVQE